MFLPTTKQELTSLGWDKLDIILVSGDTYIDSSYIGVSVIGHVLLDQGFKVGIIAQPDLLSGKDITRLGEPSLFWGVTSGSVDSMVSNYTATKKKRNKDDLTPGGINNRRPDRAVIKYTNLIKQYCSKTIPIVLGGIEASLRRIAHYDFWDNKIRRSILFDSKADYLVYGMGEKTILELASYLKAPDPLLLKNINGICYISKNPVETYHYLPGFEEVQKNKSAFTRMYMSFQKYNNTYSKTGLQQKHNDRFLIHNPPSLPLTTQELDLVYNLQYERDLHPYYRKQGDVRALQTIRFSITTHRGCFGNCNFCAIALHQGRTIISRSEQSILDEAKIISGHSAFKGIIHDLGGPTANMYGMECGLNNKQSSCRKEACIQIHCCSNMKITHARSISLLKKVRGLEKIKKVFVQSGIRYDLILKDKQHGLAYLKELVNHHISGQLKVAPEHSEGIVLSLMNKPGIKSLIEFKNHFEKMNRTSGKKQFLTYYFIAAHPGSTAEDMKKLKSFINKHLHLTPEQVQIFTPAPSTYSTTLYYTEKDPKTGNNIFVEKDRYRKEKQKIIITGNRA